MQQAYLWTKTFHIVFVVAWMACVFYLPRLLVNLVETSTQPQVQERLLLMARRLYRFGHVMFGITLVLGLVLWLHFGIRGGWLHFGIRGGWMHAKLLLVAVMFGYYLWCGRLVKRQAAGGRLPSSKALRWYNEVPLPLLVVVVWLVLAKPF